MRVSVRFLWIQNKLINQILKWQIVLKTQQKVNLAEHQEMVFPHYRIEDVYIYSFSEHLMDFWYTQPAVNTWSDVIY